MEALRGQDLSWVNGTNAIVTIVGAWLGYHVLIALYNVSPFHPLARFPGPKIAAASYLYEAYYDWILVGRYTREIRDMHQKYGPIVRINPDELHCDDPYFADEIYATGSRIRDKWQHQINTGAAGPVAVTGFSTVPHELHRIRKAALARFFSRGQTLKLEGEVTDFTQRTVNKMLRYSKKGPFDVKEAFNCFTADVIAQYAFGESMGFVDQEGWEPNFATWVKSFFQQAYMMRNNALARRLAQVALPVLQHIDKDVGIVMQQMGVTIPGYVEAAIKDPDNGRVFAEVMQSDTLPPEEKTLYRLSGEGFNFLLAGTETTAATLTAIVYYMLAQPQTYATLMAALQGVDPMSPKWTDLEQRPYLWAVVHEALRVMPGVTHRSARIARVENLMYKSQNGKVEHVIPKGTPIGMSSMINHFNEDLFPDPNEFKPERWLLPDGQPNLKLQKFLLSFGKGSRACLGEQLAYCEMFVMTAAVALRVLPRAKLYETTAEDISYDHDLIVLQTKKGSISVKITID
ncbi:hypothetical protein KJ359_003637 [Pestalotiopsis sp. 9143b]|nr:hypothetical protein KJ359_003637 [Pestalotiopsis sp. 9143b]